MPIAAADPRLAVVARLRERVAVIENGAARVPLPTLPALADVVQLRAGGSYGVDSASLALALAAGASQAGQWVGFAGWPDVGVEAAAELGIELTRTVVVPQPGEHWLEVVAALVDVLGVVVLRPPAGVDAKAAGVIEARLRARSAALVVWGQWPRCDARLSLEHAAWAGTEHGHGRLTTRRARLAVQRGTAPAVRTDVWFPGEAGGLTLAGPAGFDGSDVGQRPAVERVS